MPNPQWSTERLLWSTQGGGKYNSGNAAIGGLNTSGAAGFPPPAAVLNATGASEKMDVSGYDELLLIIILTAFTGGNTPNFQPELDILDDNMSAGVWTPDAIPLWKPAAVTTATSWLVGVSAKGLGAAPTVTGYTVVSIPFPFGNLAQFKWTAAGVAPPTAVDWKAFIYGKGRA